MTTNSRKPWLDHRGHRRCIDDLIEISETWTLRDWEKYLSSIEGKPEGKNLRQKYFRKIAENQTRTLFDVYAEKSASDSLRAFINSARRVLSVRQDSVIQLTFFEGMSLDRAAECLNLGKSTVFEHQKSALKKIQAFISVRAHELALCRGVKDSEDEPLSREEEIYEVMQQEINRTNAGRFNFDRESV